MKVLGDVTVNSELHRGAWPRISPPIAGALGWRAGLPVRRPVL